MRALVAWVRDDIALLIEQKCRKAAAGRTGARCGGCIPRRSPDSKHCGARGKTPPTHAGGPDWSSTSDPSTCGWPPCVGRRPFFRMPRPPDPAGPAHRLGQLEPDEAYYLRCRRRPLGCHDDVGGRPAVSTGGRTAAAIAASPSGGSFAHADPAGTRPAPLNSRPRTGTARRHSTGKARGGRREAMPDPTPPSAPTRAGVARRSPSGRRRVPRLPQPPCPGRSRRGW